MTMGFPVGLRNARADQITAYAGANAKFRPYTGTRPATGGAITTQTQLAEMTCGAPLAPAASNGVLTLNAIAPDSAADATGTATWGRFVKSDGTTFVADCSIGLSGSGADIIMPSVAIQAGAPVSVTSGTLTEGNA